MSNQNELEIVVLFDAPREEVFSNWTDAEKIRTWFAPDGFEVTSCTVHAQPGCEWQVQYRAANGLHYVEHGEFRVVDAPERLVFTLTQIEAGRIVLESLVTVTFTSVGLSTRMNFHQTGFDTPARRDDFRRGWGECFQKLAGSLEKSKLAATANQEPMTMTHETAATEIRALLEEWAAAVRRHDMPAILTLHAPDIVMFDLPPPLQAKGLEDYKRTWDLFFRYHKVSQAFDIEELSVVAGDDVGFAFGIMRCGAGRDPAGFQFRVTIGLRRINGAWCVVHEHHSLPAVDGSAEASRRIPLCPCQRCIGHRVPGAHGGFVADLTLNDPPHAQVPCRRFRLHVCLLAGRVAPIGAGTSNGPAARDVVDGSALLEYDGTSIGIKRHEDDLHRSDFGGRIRHGSGGCEQLLCCVRPAVLLLWQSKVLRRCQAFRGLHDSAGTANNLHCHRMQQRRVDEAGSTAVRQPTRGMSAARPPVGDCQSARCRPSSFPRPLPHVNPSPP